jgi:hypothetical protein
MFLHSRSEYPFFSENGFGQDRFVIQGAGLTSHDKTNASTDE